MEIGRIKEANAKETMDKLQPGDHDLSIVIAKGPSKCLHIASSLSVLAAVCQLIALCTPCWIEADARIYNNQFDKLGLLVFCFRSFTDPKRRYPQYFVSCRWFFDFEWKYMYDVMAPRKILSRNFFSHLTRMSDIQRSPVSRYVYQTW
jgi:hypothetical protein